MLDAGRDRALDQRARLDGVVEIIAERIATDSGTTIEPAKWMIALNAMLADDGAHEILVADIADDQRRLRRHRPAEAGRQIVEDDDALAGVDEFENHMAADIAGAAGDQDAHCATSLLDSIVFPGLVP